MNRTTINIDGKLLTITNGLILGILNATPDSFFEGSRIDDQSLLHQAEKHISEGADILDLGGFSSRPGAKFISREEEAARLMGKIKTIKHHFPNTPISVDTFRSSVAKMAVNEGASIINDISGGNFDPAMWPTIAELQVPFIAMHCEGTPENLHPVMDYENLLKHVYKRFTEMDLMACELGISDLIIDPGFGFSKSKAENFEILHNLDFFSPINRPLMVGVSRKRMTWKTPTDGAEQALEGTIAAHAIAATQGDFLYRVHDVKAMKDVLNKAQSTEKTA
ncbi:MAG: dihydropteroate synthase [Luteibaculaceae bacterium]|jgi:dihydropteroate synthase